jgi:thioredoxin reductase
VEPLSRDFYLGYAEWFQQKAGIEVVPQLVERLDRDSKGFVATLDTGETLSAQNVLLAIGFRFFQNLPPDLAEILPAGRYTHTCELVDFEPLRGKRCLVVGGRQSAFEWTAMLAEHGAASVHVSHRHDTPAFEDSDWSWVSAMMGELGKDPAWYRNLSGAEKSDVFAKFAQAKIKLEPWIWPRIDKNNIELHPNTQIISCKQLTTGELEIQLDNGQLLGIDHIILATGYKVDMTRVPFLAGGDILDVLTLHDGYPVLDHGFQSSVPGLYITSLPATRDFGPFFGFTVAVKTAARIVADALEHKGATP